MKTTNTPQFGHDSDSDSSTDALPYPQPLQRSAFLAPDFTPTAFLASLQDRHQTLEDLREELRERSQALGKELLDLVNDDYRAFLSLGGSLKGGKERVEEVRVGLLGFRREVEGLRENVGKRRKEAVRLAEERKKVQQAQRLGRGLLEVETRLEELEASLGLGGEDTLALEFSDSEDEDDDEEGDQSGLVSLGRLTKRVRHYIGVVRLRDKLGAEHPFLMSLRGRLNEARGTLLLDLATSLKQSRASEDKRQTLQILELYDKLGARAEAIKTIKTRPRQ